MRVTSFGITEITQAQKEKKTLLKHLSEMFLKMYTKKQRRGKRPGKKKSIQDKACGWTPRLALEEATRTYPMIGRTKVSSGLSLLGNKRGRSTHCVNEYKSGKKTPLCFRWKPEARLSCEPRKHVSFDTDLLNLVFQKQAAL